MGKQEKRGLSIPLEVYIFVAKDFNIQLYVYKVMLKCMYYHIHKNKDLAYIWIYLSFDSSMDLSVISVVFQIIYINNVRQYCVISSQ